jgi:uncharacterized protein YegL
MSENKELFDEMFKDKVKSKSGAKDEIVCIVDRSGSMSSIQADAQGGLNSFIAEQKKVENGANVTIIEFDGTVDTVCDQIDINESVDYKLKPRGSTALLDAIGFVVSEYDKYNCEGKTIVVVVTDGGENSSTEWAQTAIFDLINERKEQGWEFVFLAANQDAIKTAQSYGFDANSSMSFASSERGITQAYGATANYTTSLRTMSKSAALKSKSDFVEANLDVLSETGAVDDNSEISS